MGLTIERLQEVDMGTALTLLEDVFAGEQNIPVTLNSIPEEREPIWWYVENDSEMVGVIAGWKENDTWHLGRFAVDSRLRGLGIGKKLMKFALGEIFKLGAERIYTEARDVSVSILIKLGGKVIGEPFDFYGEPVTPMIIEKQAFFEE
ncbi:GNAT family N-acetyltransferase [Anoxybacterium hadale]|uniref:GNAT family N-acetyltransferase n=1 Tax=Anoxybacterium hadale TaxID=3408580 RepID=A0ACD1ACB5_9FIRM|nr:GNAT family N-acetyltransferase [Clostridiales bacterium]